MRLWILSDLHIESCRWDVPDPRPDYDVLIAAGDIHNPASAGVEWLAERAAGKPVIYVPGNHEWYAGGGERPMDREASRAEQLAREAGVTWLMDDTAIIGGVRFIGATLWTDYALYGDVRMGMRAARVGLNDHRMIYTKAVGAAFSPEDARALHEQSLAFIKQTVAEPFDGATVIVTHHLPHPKSIAPRFLGDPLNPAFCSDLSPFVEACGAALWVHGHTHASLDYRAGQTRVVCNPKGYGPRGPGAPIENQLFDPGFVVNV